MDFRFLFVQELPRYYMAVPGEREGRIRHCGDRGQWATAGAAGHNGHLREKSLLSRFFPAYSQ